MLNSKSQKIGNNTTNVQCNELIYPELLSSPLFARGDEQ